jgi:hypothetical protein
MISPPPPHSNQAKAPEPPWYRQFWPWFIIALPASAVIASLITFYLAVSRPDHLVVEDEEYRLLNSELKGQAAEQVSEKTDSRAD